MQVLNEINTLQSQLSIQIENTDLSEVDTNPNESQSVESTPLKSHNYLENSSDESSLCERDSCYSKRGLSNTVVSTPIQFTRIPFKSTPLQNQSLISIVKRKPTVNFHSIDDIVYGSSSLESSNNDSGVGHSFNSFQYKLNNEIESFSEQNEDKENQVKSVCKNDKKFRTTFTDEQKKMLDVYFNQNPYPDPKETEDMSHHLGLPENVIKVWFQNKRSRDKQRKFSRDNNSRRSEYAQQPLSKTHNFNQSPLMANLQFLSNQIKAAAALSAFRNFNNL